MSDKTMLQQQIESQSGLTIEKVTNKDQLNDYLNRGLAELYKNVFAEPPYFEKFSIEDVKESFQEMLEKKGNIFVALDPARNNTPIAFVASIPLKTSFSVASAVKDKVNLEEAAYFAEDGVETSYRRRGLSGGMKKLLLEAASLSGFKKMVIRTSQNSYTQISAINKAGFTVLPDVLQSIESDRLDGSRTADTRALYTRDLNKAAPTVEQLDKVIVLRQGNKDIAYICSKSFPSYKTDWRIRKTYPGIQDTRFGDPYKKRNFLNRLGNFLMGNEFNRKAIRNATEVFKGRIYLSNDLQAPPPSPGPHYF